MISELNFPILMRSCKTIREKNGLAMSSRNKYLSIPEKEEASIIYKALKKSEYLINKGEKINNVKTYIKRKLTNDKIIVDYISISDINTFKELNVFKKNINIVICIAVRYGSVRLIDNIIIQKK